MTTTVPTHGGPAVPVSSDISGKTMGRVALRAYGFPSEADAIAAGFHSEAGPASSVYVVSAAELVSGKYVLEGDPKATPIYTAPSGMRVEGGYSQPVYLVGGSLSNATPPVVPSTLLNSLVAYWKLDEASGNRLDSVATSSMIPVNTPAQAAGIAYKTGKSAKFVSASSQYLHVADSPALSVGDIDFTIACWVTLASKSADMSAFAQYLSTGNQRAWSINYAGSATDRLRFSISSDGTSTTFVALAADALGSPLLNTAYFIVAWHNSVANTLNIQINDGAINSVAHTSGVKDSSGDVVIGAISNPLQYWDGLIDECGIWKRVLTAAERTALFAGGAGITYPFTPSTSAPSAPFDVFIIAGQSNAGGRGTNNQIYTGAAGEAWQFANSYVYLPITDPVDSTGGQIDTVSLDPVSPPQGSIWPLVANGLVAAGKRVVFVPCALGGSTIANWQPGANHQDRTTLYGSMIYRALQVQAAGGTLRAVLWWQGEADTALTQAQYNAALDTFANAVFADLGIPIIPTKLQDLSPQLDNTSVNAAIVEAWGDNANVKVGVDISDIAHDDNTWGGITYHVHICSDSKLATVAGRWVTAIKAIFGW